MRSKEVKSAIDILTNVIADHILGDYCVEICNVPCNESAKEECIYQDAIDKVIEYIEELEKLPNKVMNKIKELKEELDEFEKTDNSGRFKRENSRDYDKLEVLKSIIGE